MGNNIQQLYFVFILILWLYSTNANDTTKEGLNPCLNGGMKYILDNGSLVCDCPNQYAGQYCELINYCATKNSLLYCKERNAKCFNEINNFVCKCDDSSFWNSNMSRCDPSSCHTSNVCDQLCFDDEKNSGKIRCDCTYFYLPNGNSCILKPEKLCNCKHPSFCNNEGQCICKHGFNLDVDKFGTILGCKQD